MPMSVKEGANFFEQIGIALPGAEKAMLEHAAQMVEREAKAVIGTYTYGWPQLQLATQLQRERQGFNPNDPLLKTGELRDSIQHVVEDNVAYVGSNNPIALWQELGTSRIPPRSFLAGAAQHKEAEIVEFTGKSYFQVLAGGKIEGIDSPLEEATRYERLYGIGDNE